jgi:ATP-dependent RNA helicase DHX29
LQQIEEIRQQYLSYLVDASFIHVDSVCQKELSRYAHLFILYRRSHRPTSARFTSRQRVRFVSVPPDLNTNAQNNESWAINAALAAGLFPKLLIVENGKMQMLGNSQPVGFHPSSVNFRRRPGDVVGGGTCLMYFTLMYVRCGLRDVENCGLTWSGSRHSKKLYVWETSPVNNHALLLLCGDVEVKVCPLLSPG